MAGTFAGRCRSKREIQSIEKYARYWFPAKRFGWGWGPPSTWQGWMVTLVIAGLMVAGILFLLPIYGAAVSLAYALALSLLHLLICLKKGEPPGWRWGSK